MTTLKETLTILFKNAIQSTYGLEMDPVIKTATRAEFGDFQANFALGLAKKIQKNPVVLATEIADQLRTEPLFKELVVSGPGFINIHLDDAFLATHVQNLLQDPRLGIPLLKAPETIVIDYGGANVAKEMHVGHLRSAIIGDALVRILSFIGHHVIRQNHLGDWGTQFGMLIEYLMQTDWKADQTQNYSELNTLYKKAKHQFDTDTEFAYRARARVVALQGGETQSRAIWQQLVDESKTHFQKTYDKLNLLLCKEDAVGESFYNDKLATLVDELSSQGVAHLDQGAVVIYLDGFKDPDGNPLPFLIRKQDGGYLYATTDLAALSYRLKTLKANRILYVVDARQKQHFAMLFAAGRKVFNLPETLQLSHIAYGSVLGDDHKPLKTRSGESIKLNDLLIEAEKRAAELVAQKHPDLSPDDLASIAQRVGIGALKYADLRSDKVKDYVFSWDKMLAFEGNTGPYLQNAYVRIYAIFRKGNIDVEMLPTYPIQLGSDIEHALAIKLCALADVIETISLNLQIHSLCDYLYDLASTFHRFYEHCPVLNVDDPEIRRSRLALCALTAKTLALGLGLLGIDVLERM
ncbi:MAG: arginine--tRNA ligase [Gammaproteobacteria bacterium]|nr:arginine--tRNA ligase [Gammaproteobacteria bacterium]